MRLQTDRENLTRLSDDISDDNRYKQILLDMERPLSKALVYSFLVISLTVYFWMFFLKMIYFKAPYTGVSFFIVCISTLGIFLTYKKEIMGRVSSTLPFNIITIFLLIFSSFVVSFDSGTYSNEEIIKSFLITSTVDKKSYLSLAVLAFLTLGISKTYPVPYHKHWAFYKESPMKIKRTNVNKMRLLSVFTLLFFPKFLQGSFNQAGGNAAMGLFFCIIVPESFYLAFIYPRYLKIYQKAKKIDERKEEGTEATL